MKKHVLLFSMIAALVLSGCQNNASGGDENNSGDEGQTSADASGQPASSQWVDSYVPPEPETITGDNFTINIPADLSSMSANSKKYVDDMRAQQRRLIAEKGANADYYLNDLYGESGVDLTKGVTPCTGDSGTDGGYRDGKTPNDYLDNVAAEWEKGEKSDENKGITITFTPSDALKNKGYTITYGKKADLSDGQSFVTTQTSFNLKNLLVNQKYYFKIASNGQESSVASFTTGDYPRWIDARPMFNVRDMGGYKVKGGKRIKQGLVYRGGEITPESWNSGQSYTGDTGGRYTNKSTGKMQDGHIATQTDDSKKIFRDQDIVSGNTVKKPMNMVNGVEIDLRSSTERAPSGKSYTSCGFANKKSDGTTNDIDYKLISISSYDNGMKNNTSNIKQVFDLFAKADTNPVYFHCYGGADRTGVTGFLLGAMLGMSYTDLVIDFELTSFSSNPSRNYRSHLRNGPYNYWPRMLGYLRDTLHWDNSITIQDGAKAYLKEKCKVTDATIQKIESIMLENAQK